MSEGTAAPAIDLDIIKKYAPKIFLNPYDNSRPTSVERYLTTVNLYHGNGTPITETVDFDALVRYNEATNYMEVKDGNFPTAQNDFHTGDPIVPGDTSGYGRCLSPVYVKTFSYDTHVDILYIFFYAFNSFQTFRIGIGVPTKKRSFPWSRFARHGGDWEHVTIRLTKDLTQLLGVFYSQHGHSTWIEKPPIVNGSHPVVYSALNSHASYPTSGVTELDYLIHPPGLQPIGWLKVADVTNDEGMVYYAKPNPFFSTVEWTPDAGSEQLVLLDENPDAAKWLGFLGRWGPADLDNTHIDRPPALPDDAQDRLFDYAKVGKFFNALGKYMHGAGPVSPEQQGWWIQKEQVMID